MTDFKDIIKPKEKEKEEEGKKSEEVFTQIQRDMLKSSILKIAMLANQMSEMSGNRDYSSQLDEVSGAEVVLENVLKGESAETRKTYFAEAEERAKIEGLTDIDIMAKDAVALKKAQMSHADYHIDSTSGRVVVDGKEKNAPEEEDELDEPELSL